MNGYPIGTRVTFADANATVSDGVPGVVTGMVNGPPMLDDDGNVAFLPVFCQRDKNREATTIWVAASNLLGEADG